MYMAIVNIIHTIQKTALVVHAIKVAGVIVLIIADITITKAKEIMTGKNKRMISIRSLSSTHERVPRSRVSQERELLQVRS